MWYGCARRSRASQDAHAAVIRFGFGAGYSLVKKSEDGSALLRSAAGHDGIADAVETRARI